MKLLDKIIEVFRPEGEPAVHEEAELAKQASEARERSTATHSRLNSAVAVFTASTEEQRAMLDAYKEAQAKLTKPVNGTSRRGSSHLRRRKEDT